MVFLCVIYSINAQTIDFEDFPLDSTGVYNGVPDANSFPSEFAVFENTFTDSYWSGFAVSSLTDTETPGFANDLSVYDSGGASGSNFVVGSVFGTLTINFTKELNIGEISLNNGTYAALSMQNVDQYAKKFGGDSGDDPDYFLLKIAGVNEVGDTTGIVDFYLADFRFDDNTQDYIVQDWTTVDLSSLGAVSQLKFALESSDVGEFCMNTPAYFCLDDIVALENVGFEEYDFVEMNVYPQPALDVLNFTIAEPIKALFMVDMTGKTVYANYNINANGTQLDVSNLATGIYILNVQTESGFVSKSIYKN